MIICERCVKGNEGVRIIAERYAGREGSGVMIIEREGRLLGATKALEEKRDQDLGDLGEDSEDENDGKGEKGEGERISNGGESGEAFEEEETGNDTKRKLERMVEEEPITKKPRLNDEIGGPSTSSSSSSSLPSSSAAESSSSAASSIPPTAASSTLASSTSSRTCHAPPALSSPDTPLTKLASNGGRLNLFLGNDWMDNWCRCEEVRRFRSQDLSLSLFSLNLAGTDIDSRFIVPTDV